MAALPVIVTVAPGATGFGEIVTSKDWAESMAPNRATHIERRRIDMRSI
jgi:hypothetical protein